MKKLLIFFYFIFLIMPVYGYEIAFPKQNNIVLSHDGVFFAGNADKNETLWINDRKINIKPNGAFAELFKLELGENVFTIRTNKNLLQKSYTVTRINPISNKTELIEFPSKYYKTTCEDVVLRSTPIDFGMNRIGYLPKNMDLVITGQKNEFSRVYLNNEVSGWVMTKYITIDLEKSHRLGEYKGEFSLRNDNTKIIEYRFSKNLPYSALYKDKKLYIDVFNIENGTFHREIPLESPYCYSVKMSDSKLTVEIPQINIKSEKPRIIIDAGHGGKEIGAVGCFMDKEKDMNLKAAKTLEKELKSKKFNVSLTRYTDTFMSLQDRIDFAKNEKAVIFISLHMNSIPESFNPNNYKGSETYYYTDFSKTLAECVQVGLTKSLKTHDNGVKQMSYAVIRPTEYVGILVETAFLVNPEDTEIYKSKQYFKKTAKGIANGIEEYLSKY